MKRLSLRVRVAGPVILLVGLLLAACGPRTPNAAAETPFNPTAQLLPGATNPPSGYPASTSEPPAATLPPDSYPAGTVQPPPATAAQTGYPAGDGATQPATQAAPTEDPYETGAATNTPAPPAATATLEPLFITYRDFEIVPTSNSARIGQQVIFLIQSESGAFHQPYAGDSAPFIFEAPPNMGHGVSWPITFNNAQRLTLLCGYHPNMRARLTIEP
jgi:hypothetical protein